MTLSSSRRSVLIAAGGLAFPTIAMRRASAQDRTLHVGVYNSAQGGIIRRELLPRFEREHRVRVLTTEGATLANIAALRATRNAPRYSVMSMDDVGVPQAKSEGLIDALDPNLIPNLAKVYRRFLFEDGYGVGFAVSSAAMFYNTSAVRGGIGSYEQIWDRRFRRRLLLNTPRNTQSVLMLIVAAALATGKPLQEAQYLADEGWARLAELKPNVLTVYDGEGLVMQVAQGQADIGGIEYSKAIYPHTARGIPMDMAFPREGSFTGINGLVLVKNAPERELGCTWINMLLSAEVQKMLAEQTLSAPTVADIEFRPDVQRFLAYPETKMQDMGLFTPDWNYIVPRRGPWLERYNQVFTG